jgi:hypothetical protein
MRPLGPGDSQFAAPRPAGLDLLGILLPVILVASTLPDRDARAS